MGCDNAVLDVSRRIRSANILVSHKEAETLVYLHDREEGFSIRLIKIKLCFECHLVCSCLEFAWRK